MPMMMAEIRVMLARQTNDHFAYDEVDMIVDVDDLAKRPNALKRIRRNLDRHGPGWKITALRFVTPICTAWMPDDLFLWRLSVMWTEARAAQANSATTPPLDSATTPPPVRTDPTPCTLSIFGRPLVTLSRNDADAFRHHLAELDDCDDCTAFRNRPLNVRREPTGIADYEEG